MPRFYAALLLTAVLSCFAPLGSANAQGFPGQQPAPQQKMVLLNEQSLPQMLQGHGFQVQEQADGLGKYWTLQNQQLGTGHPLYVDLTKNQSGHINGLMINAPLGAKLNTSDPALASTLLGLMKANARYSRPLMFSYNEKSGFLQLTFIHSVADSNQAEIGGILADMTKLLNETRPIWSRQGGNVVIQPPAPQPDFNNQGFTPLPAPKPDFNNQGFTPPLAPKPDFNPLPPVQGIVANTTWSGSENLQGFGKVTFQLNAGGEAFMYDAQAKVKGNWAQSGNQVTITFGNCIYQGTINGQVLSGTARYTTNTTTWTFTVTKSS